MEAVVHEIHRAGILGSSRRSWNKETPYLMVVNLADESQKPPWSLAVIGTLLKRMAMCVG
jgi:hypothetical protein